MKSFKINRIIFSVGALIIGVILLVWPSTSLVIMAKCIGAFLAGGGLVAGFLYFQDHETAMKSVLLIMAVIMLICGIVIFLHPEELIKLIPTIIGVLVMISGLINLGETFLLNRQKYSRWWISLIVAVITIAAGIFIVSKAFSLASLITRIAGGVLIFDGLSDLWVISRLSSSAKKTDEAVQSAATVDVSAQEVKPAAGSDKPQDKKPDAAPSPEEHGQEKEQEEKKPSPAAEAKEDSKPELVFGDPAPKSAQDNATEEDDSMPEYMYQEEQDQEYHAPQDLHPGDPGKEKPGK